MISTRSTLSSTYAEVRPSAIARASAQPGGAAVARPDDLRVEGAGQAAVAGHEQEADRLDALLHLEDRQARDVLGRLRGARGHPPDRVRVRPQVLDPQLRPAQARGGDHLHGARDLADVLDRADAPADVLQRGHRGLGAGLLRVLLLAGLLVLLGPGLGLGGLLLAPRVPPRGPVT